MLDRTEQRIVGVLIEKAATVPDIYPMSEKALRDGCNQKSNRDPTMELESFQIAGALMALQQKEWVVRIDGGSRVTKYRHKVTERLGLSQPELAVLCELLLRGPQAPGALKPRVQRLGLHADPAGIEQVLQQLASRPQPLVAQLPLGPRERDRRWQHLLAHGSEAAGVLAAAGPAAGPAAGAAAGAATGAGTGAGTVPPLRPVANPTVASAATTALPVLEVRVAALEQQVAELRAQVLQIQQSQQGEEGG